MHPIERLRYVARASGAPAADAAREAIRALGAFRDDPHALYMACRRLVDRHPGSGPMLWMASHVLTAADPRDGAVEAARRLDGDTTAADLAEAIADDATVVVLGWPDVVAGALARRGDLVVLESGAIGPAEFLAVAGSFAAAAVANACGVPVWLAGGVGRVLPQAQWDAVAGRALAAADEPWSATDEIVPLAVVDCVAGPGGLAEVAAALATAECPLAPELLVLSED